MWSWKGRGRFCGGGGDMLRRVMEPVVWAVLMVWCGVYAGTEDYMLALTVAAIMAPFGVLLSFVLDRAYDQMGEDY